MPAVTPSSPDTEKKAPAAAPAPAPTAGTAVEATGDEHGRTTIAQSVVAKIASLAALEVAGVDSLGGAISGAIAGVVGRVKGAEHKTAGVGVEVGTRQAAVDLTMTVQYPFPIHEVADQVRQNVTERVEAMTGLEVVEVNIAVTDLAFESDGSEASPVSVGGSADRVA